HDGRKPRSPFTCRLRCRRGAHTRGRKRNLLRRRRTRRTSHRIPRRPRSPVSATQLSRVHRRRAACRSHPAATARERMMDTNEVLTLRLQLLQAGYLPIPLYGKAPPQYGKNNPKKGFAGWQKIESITPEMLEMGTKTWPDASNTGVLTRTMPTL